MIILYYFQEIDTPMFQWQRTHIIDELIRHNIEVETFNPLIYNSVEEANERVIELVKGGHYDLFMTNVAYFKMLFVETLREIKKIGVPTFTVSWDNLMFPSLDKVLAPHFDLMWLTAKETVRLYDKWGAHYYFAPYAANPYTFSYERSPINRKVCFIGTPHGSRSKMINILTKEGVDVDLYSGKDKNMVVDDKEYSIPVKYNIINPSILETNFLRLFFSEGRKLLMGSIVNRIKGQTKIIDNNCLSKHYSLPHEKMVYTYSSTTLSLSSSSAGHTDVLKKPLNIINLRNFEIPMCGGIELCKYNEELAEYFETDKEIIFYHDDNELVDKARYYTQRASDAEIYAIKEAARKRAESDHTWWNRFKIAFDRLGLKYE